MKGNLVGALKDYRAEREKFKAIRIQLHDSIMSEPACMTIT